MGGLREAGVTFASMISEGFASLSTGITEVVKNPIVVGVIGVSLAYFVAKKSIRLIKSR